MRLIPGKTKVQIELFKGVTLGDIFIGVVAAVLVVFVLTSSLPGKLFFIIGLVLVAALLLVRLDSEPNYIFLLHILRYLGYKHRFKRKRTDAEILPRAEGEEDESDIPVIESKEDKKARLKAESEERKADDRKLKDPKVSKEEKDAIWLKRANQSAAKKAESKSKKDDKAADMSEIIGFTDIKDGYIEYGGEYYGTVIEVEPVEFRFFSENRRANSIEASVGRILRQLSSEFSANIVKIERPIIYDDYLTLENEKMDSLRLSYENGVITEEEFKARVDILCNRMDDLKTLCYDTKVVQPFYYIVLYDSDKNQLNNYAYSAVEILSSGEIKSHRLNTKELAVFLKYTNHLDFDERDIEKIAPEDYAEWAMPQSITMQQRNVIVDGILAHNMHVVGFPSQVDDAWLASVMSIPGTKVMVKFKPMDRAKAIRGIDRSIQELRGQYVNTGVDSKMMELQEHIETLEALLATLQGDNETLLEVNIYVTAYDIVQTKNTLDPDGKIDSSLARISNMKRVVRRLYQENGLRLNNMDFDQVAAFIGGQVTAWDPMGKKGRGIPSNSVAACYPWVFAHVADKNGIKLGSSDGVPVFIDFFRRDSERVNSNMVIVGKSGSGKSYATKSLLTNLAADDSKIFILDPENEYTELAANLHGKFINVGNAQYGRLNPFHIITALDDDENDSSGISGSYATHLQFLEEFFRQIIPDCDKDSMEYLNSLIDRMYTNMGITAETDLSMLRPEDYPTFDDLYDAILAEFQSTDNEYIRTMLRTLMNYIAKFSSGGRNANIWNGPSTVTTDENFTVFNFQSLLANRNGTVANAQMLLVLKYIDNEIIKNRDYNLKYHMNRKIVVVIDEAHVFIDTKFPVALDFMFQLAKRIRKYNGMQIVITQNIKDFVGSEEIARKSTAIINACQYSFIFALAPNDMDDLCKLYEKAGGINENEQEQIVSAPRGQAFTVMSPSSRSTVHIDVPENVEAIFDQPDYKSSFFDGEGGEEAWNFFVGTSRDYHDENLANSAKNLPEREDFNTKKSRVTFVELTEEEAEAEEMLKPKQSNVLKRSVEVEEKKQTAKAPADEDFDDIPEIPDDPAEFAELKKKSTRPVPTENVQIPQVVVQAPATSGETERILGTLLDRFSYESMIQEIRRSVREELEKELAERVPAQTPAYSDEYEEDDTAGTTSGGTSLGSIFNQAALDERRREAEEAAAASAAEDEDEYGIDDLSTDLPTDDDSEGGFDIMKMLMIEAQNMETISPIDMMQEYEEEILEITLEELVQYNSMH